MSKREAEVAVHAHLLPVLLAFIKERSEVNYSELYRRLGAAMGLSPDSVKRNWLRWRAVKPHVDQKGRLAHTNSLKALIQAASSCGWLGGVEASPCAPLIIALGQREDDRLRALELSMRRRAVRIRAAVQSLVQERRLHHFDDVGWLSAVSEAVGDAVAMELRARLLEAARDPDLRSTELVDDLLAGKVTRAIRTVLDAATRPLRALEADADRLEKEARRAFDEQRTEQIGDDTK